MGRPARTFIFLLAVAWASGARSAPSADVDYGRRIAERACSGCHAVALGASPNPRAPPFRDLHLRYRRGGLDALLTEGMLAPVSPPEEGSARFHPKMPQVALDDDEIAALKAYLHSLEPRRGRIARRAAP